MSGLNIAFLLLDELVKASLECERKAELARREQERMLAQEQRRKDELRSALASDLSRFQAQCDRIELNASDAAQGAVALTGALRRTAASITSGAGSMSESQLREARKKLKECFLSLAGAQEVAQRTHVRDDLVQKAAAEQTDMYGRIASASFAEAHPDAPAIEVQNEFKQVVAAGAAENVADPDGTRNLDMEPVKAAVLGQLDVYGQDPDLPMELRSKLAQSARTLRDIHDPEYLRNYISLTARPLAEQARTLLDQYARNEEEFATLSNRYEVLCELYSHDKESFDASDASLQQLKERIAAMEREAAEDAQKAYIGESVDAVMQEMGYDVLGFREVTKKSGRHFRNELFDYGDGTAVNVTYAQNGQISMEIGALDTEDRLPDEAETSQLCGVMEHFCEDYDIIQKKLLERGVILARPDRKPPSPAYAQVINTSDFDMLTEAENFSVSHTAKRTRQPSARHREA